MRRLILLLLLLLLLLLFIVSPSPALSAAPHLRLQLQLQRQPDPPGTSRLNRLRAMIQIDQHRRRAFEKLSRPPDDPAMEMPLISGAYIGTGQYFVSVRIGTPPKPFLLVADTGSDLTWVTCRYRRAAGSGFAGDQQSGLAFEASQSSSFQPINCSSELCRKELPFALTKCPTADAPCSYDYRYAQGSSAQGIFAKESITAELSDRRQVTLNGMVVGCTSSSVGSSFTKSDGVLALGYGANTFVSGATARFGSRFSYCLVDHLSSRNATGYLAFGSNPDLLPAALVAHLVIKPELQPFYYVAVSGISVAGEVLRIPLSVWDDRRHGGAIVDSGTTLTVLAEPAYQAVVGALSRRLTYVPRLKLDPFEYCYNWTSPAAARASIPELVLHFVGAATLSPPAKSYLIDVADGVKCLGFVSTPWPGVSVIGNIMQQGYIWEFDLKNQWLRFGPSSCTAGSTYR
ncbi:Aspartic proteinase nepenthesin-2 [Apostasia shenzhenica]|uniref:Aspartic proteinase nepenthesin-2 n=1 Tax=Apostasia shenzhenica TaxID=1088818 RepID=A0A2I0B092_9ASPA|nr:Aspartic proteinase nepenthesin-2 [Apostasia shenzhenica]